MNGLEQERVVVLGDVGGHPDVLRRSVASVGGDPQTMRLPQGVALVQVGDVVRCSRAPAIRNDECIELVDRAMSVNGEMWVQLLGNHDLALLGGEHRRGWAVGGTARPETVATLERWWNEEVAVLATSAVSADLGPVLITHAGLTVERWNMLGRPSSPAEAAEAINVDVGSPVACFSRAGDLVGSSDPLVDVTWAEVNSELLTPWLVRGKSPFAQVHGHASPFNWQAQEFWEDASPDVRSATRVNANQRRTVTEMPAGSTFVSVDWMLGDVDPGRGWDLLELSRPKHAR